MQLEPKNTAPLHESQGQPKIVRLVRMEESENSQPTDHFAKCWGYSGMRFSLWGYSGMRYLGMRCLSSIVGAHGPVSPCLMSVSSQLLSPLSSYH